MFYGDTSKRLVDPLFQINVIYMEKGDYRNGLTCCSKAMRICVRDELKDTPPFDEMGLKAADIYHIGTLRRVEGRYDDTRGALW